jgi:hypothetical protein
MTRDELRQFAYDNNCKWSMQDGKLLLVPFTSYKPHEAVLLSSNTGLIGVPEQQIDGIHMRTLINPLIKIGQLVQLDNSVTINTLRLGLDRTSIGSNQYVSNLIKTNPKGLYYVMVANHQGDTRGQAWWSDLTCLSVAVDKTANPASAFDAAIFPDVGAIKRY